MIKRRTILAGMAASCTLGFPWLGHAQGKFPAKTIKLYVMYDPGGASDFQARIATSLANKYYGESVVVVNKVGAGGMTGWNEFVTSARPDGYELASYNVPSFISQSIHFKDRTKYNIGNLLAIANWGTDPVMLVVPKESKFNTLEDFVEFGRKNPGKITANGAGLYTGHHIALLQFMNAADVKITYVPDTGAVPAMQKVMSNHIACGFNNFSDTYRNRERIKILATAAATRNMEFLPDVPTFKELGFEFDDITSNLRGLMAPAGTPEDVMVFLEKKSLEMFNDKDIKGKMFAGASPMRIMNREETTGVWHRTDKILKALFKEIGA